MARVVVFQILMGKMMEQGPVLIIHFNVQQIQCVRDAQGVVKEGDPVSVRACVRCACKSEGR